MKRSSHIRLLLVTTLCCRIAFCDEHAEAADWPTYRRDVQRSGVSPETLEFPLARAWVYGSTLPPSPAWPDPARQNYLGNKFNLKPRNTDDRAFQAVVSAGRLYFGSSADGKIYCLDVLTGDELWTFYTGGPVRYAPVVGDQAERVFAASDDGWVYCLDASSGRLLWKYTPQPRGQWIANDGKLISTWPVRAGLALEGGILYMCSGLFPLQGTYQRALNASDGSVIWQKDAPLSAQGYLLASPVNQLIVPTGRAGPALVDKQTGEYLKTLDGHGGTRIVLTERIVVAGPGDTESGQLEARDIKTLAHLVNYRGRHIVAHNGVYYLQHEDRLSAVNAGRNDTTDDKKQLRWEIECGEAHSLILAGQHLVAGGSERVAAYRRADGAMAWSHSVQGAAYGLAVADGRLFVSTDRGKIYCFASGDVSQRPSSPTPRMPPNPSLRTVRIAELICSESPQLKGYCLILGAADGRLAHEIARRTDLQITVIDEDPVAVDRARKYLEQKNVYGGRVTVQVGSFSQLACSDFLINLLVVDPSVKLDFNRESIEEFYRVLRPMGGTAMVHFANRDAAVVTIDDWQKVGEIEQIHAISADDGAWLAVRRDRLFGTSDWTHMYADPGNSACGADQHVNSYLDVQWFGRPGPREMVNRHHHPTAPLAIEGRLFVPGNQRLYCLDLYNGTLLWEQYIPAASRLRADLTGNIFAGTEDTLYMAVDDKCLRIDPSTGQQRAPLTVPQMINGTRCDWGYTAVVGDVIIGTGQKPEAAFRRFTGDGVAIATWSPPTLVTSDYVFAMDRHTGELLWRHRAGVIPNPAIAIGDGRVFFVESDSETTKAESTGKVNVTELVADGHARLVALDLQTGQESWSVKPELGDLQRIIYTSYAEGVVLIAGSFVRDNQSMHLLSAHDARTGRGIWMQDQATQFSDVNSGHGELQRHPAIVKGVVYADPWAYNLHTGVRLDSWRFQRGGHGCGPVTAAANTLFGRAGTHGAYNIAEGGRVNHISKVARGGCWIHMLPVGGMLAIPESSSGCTCGFAVQTSMGFRSATRRPAAFKKREVVVISKDALPLEGRHWSVYDTPGGTPSKSDWQVDGHTVTELSNLHGGDATNGDPGLERGGTFRIYDAGGKFTNGELTLDMSSNDDDVYGVAFRYQDKDHYYLFAMDKQRGFRVIAKKDGDSYTVLAANAHDYRPFHWYQIRIVLNGPSITVYLDGDKELESSDRGFERGTFALHAWGCAGASFRNIVWKEF
jgi:outer membrane protein assembly factor BamB